MNIQDYLILGCLLDMLKALGEDVKGFVGEEKMAKIIAELQQHPELNEREASIEVIKKVVEQYLVRL